MGQSVCRWRFGAFQTPANRAVRAVVSIHECEMGGIGEQWGICSARGFEKGADSYSYSCSSCDKIRDTGARGARPTICLRRLSGPPRIGAPAKQPHVVRPQSMVDSVSRRSMRARGSREGSKEGWSGVCGDLKLLGVVVMMKGEREQGSGVCLAF